MTLETMTREDLALTLPETEDNDVLKRRQLALLKAVGLDRHPVEVQELALAIATRYGLDLMLKHLVIIDGRPYITRDGLLHVAHRSGVFDGISVTVPVVENGFWRCTATVYRKDMSRPFEYPGRYPTSGGNQKYAPEMCIKVGESMALRRAFNVSAPVVEERWDGGIVDSNEDEPAAPTTLEELAAQKAAALEVEGLYSDPQGEPQTTAAPEPASEPTVADDPEAARLRAFRAQAAARQQTT